MNEIETASVPKGTNQIDELFQKDEMKSRIAVWASSFAGVLWIIVGLRDTHAPGFFTMGGSVKSKLDIAMEFATGAVFLLVAALFQRSSQQPARKAK